MDPSVFLQGDQFDAVMNYRWYRIARGLFGQAQPVLKPSAFIDSVNSLNKDIKSDNLKAMMNVPSTHDTPRLSTSLYNKTLYKYRTKPEDDPNYKINKPDEITRKEQVLLLINQFTFIGAPQIWNGEEVGMWGADDPDCRKPLIWDDLDYEVERTAYDPSQSRSPDIVKPDNNLLVFYKNLCMMRRENTVLIDGDLSFFLADDDRMLLGYRRSDSKEEITVLFNCSEEGQELNTDTGIDASYLDLLSGNKRIYKTQNRSLKIFLESRSAVVLKRVTD